jgi:hypothetical protein
MAVLMLQTLPVGVPVEMLDAVTKEMNVESDPPNGLILHVHYEGDGRAQIHDVWDSEDDYSKFRDARLIPAMIKVAEQHGMQLEPPPDPVFIPVQGLVKGS